MRSRLVSSKLVWAIAAAIAALAVVAVACGGGEERPVATPVAGAINVEMGDNFFGFQGQRKPTIVVKLGSEVTVDLVNKGEAIHNMRIAGLDNKYDSADDFISRPDTMKAGDKGTLVLRLEKAGTYKFRCDFHPDEMMGAIKVQ